MLDASDYAEAIAPAEVLLEVARSNRLELRPVCEVVETSTLLDVQDRRNLRSGEVQVDQESPTTSRQGACKTKRDRRRAIGPG